MYKITAIVEKGPDGMYSIRSEQHLDNNYFGGFGDTIAAAKDDFCESVKDAFNEAKENGRSNGEYAITFRYDMPSFFADFDFINASKFAQYAGINESNMRQYKSGVAFPGEKTLAKILDAVHRIGTELCSVSL